MSLAQFSRKFMSSKPAGGPIEVAGFVGLGQKRFAADVVAAMSNPETPAPDAIPGSLAIKNKFNSGFETKKPRV
jgi:hypothetical protein